MDPVMGIWPHGARRLSEQEQHRQALHYMRYHPGVSYWRDQTMPWQEPDRDPELDLELDDHDLLPPRREPVQYQAEPAPGLPVWVVVTLASLVLGELALFVITVGNLR